MHKATSFDATAPHIGRAREKNLFWRFRSHPYIHTHTHAHTNVGRFGRSVTGYRQQKQQRQCRNHTIGEKYTGRQQKIQWRSDILHHPFQWQITDPVTRNTRLHTGMNQLRLLRDCDINLPGPSLSKYHCVSGRQADHYINDRGKRNLFKKKLNVEPKKCFSRLYSKCIKARWL